MKTKTMILLLQAAVLCAVAAEGARAVSPAPDELAESRQWVAGTFEGDEPFFSFSYGGRPSAEVLPSWKAERTREQLDDQRTQHVLTYTDPETGLVVRCVGIEYADFPTVEWTLYFQNSGARDTPILADIRALDIRVEGANSTSEFRLHHHVGSPCAPQDYRPLETVLKPGASKRISAAGGRPTNSDLPYFNLERPGGSGLIVVVGWPGQWAAEFTCEAENRLHVHAGQELTRLKLLPGEEIRSPLVVLQFWKGDRLRSQNLWRRWMLAHNVPRPGGKLPPLFLSASSSYYYAVMARADAASQIYFFDRYREEGMPLDYWWMDAGWYPCDNWPQTGTWEVETKRFPKGLGEVSDHVKARGGTGTIVWFEPERVHSGTWLANERPEWIYGEVRSGGGNLLDLGHPDAWSWLVNHIDKLIVEQGIGLYRQDFNIDPLGHWRANDAPDRQGMSEIKHVVGYLAFWDELRRRHPEMLIDTCASGGRRNDLETLRRAVPLLRSDYWRPGSAQQCQTYGIASWIPYFGASMQDSSRHSLGTWGRGEDVRVWEDVYLMRSSLLPLLSLRFDMRAVDRDYTLARRVVDQWRQVGRYYLGDYYPLTPYSLEENVWMAWQFNCPESGEGLVQAFRRQESPEGSARLKLHGLQEDAVYTLVNLDVSDATEMTGRELMDVGLPIAIEDQPGDVMISYKKR
jgi:alpha-galactosidase